MKTNAQKTNRKIWIGAMIGIALVALFFQPRTVSGQQWTGPDGSGNIWHGNAAVLIFAWKNNSGNVTTQTVGSGQSQIANICAVTGGFTTAPSLAP